MIRKIYKEGERKRGRERKIKRKRGRERRRRSRSTTIKLLASTDKTNPLTITVRDIDYLDLWTHPKTLHNTTSANPSTLVRLACINFLNDLPLTTL